ncbi:S-layer homology domain-containing protein [Paenibacillus sp. LHD-117]|uniref:S-layer homology domain-containing protein n=1 Tax=Paenibacillus sp. LHD-117 TaxID=3071412 RepID=UPI0027E0509B|nr:S-layer homology domain-containing protein [Paenibacillus sp. LHD-117]MDQ6422584.1 S-layer homology domain-containing protein [Paenibacillus sp. LHD-117]
MNRKILSLMIAICLITSLIPIAATAKEEVKITKTFELTNAVDYISFTLEGFDGEFASVMTIPGGNKISSSKSNKIVNGDKTYWSNNYILKPAPKGKYVFEITAPKSSYYNLVVDIPLFSDIATHWAKDAITDYVRKGVINGYGNGRFGPDDDVTGQALIKMAVLALTEELPNGMSQWKKEFRWKVANEDISTEMGWQEYKFVANPGEHWSQPYTAAANDVGISTNWSESQLSKSFKRKDVALLVANIMSLVNSKETPNPTAYNDLAALNAEYKKAIGLVSSSAIFNGYPDGYFRPEAVVTRAETVKILSRLDGYLQ